ncbi:hypothetical protein GCM10025794_27110 [Massilia kyonggiensis]
MRLYVPMRVDIARIVLFDACGLDLLKPPLWEVHVAGTQIAAQNDVSQAECSCQGSDPASVP